MASDGRGREGKHIEFVTPKIGFPMEQYYRPEDPKLRRFLHLQARVRRGRQAKGKFTKYSDPASTRGQVAERIVPTSSTRWTATHLMMTALKCID